MIIVGYTHIFETCNNCRCTIFINCSNNRKICSRIHKIFCFICCCFWIILSVTDIYTLIRSFGFRSFFQTFLNSLTHHTIHRSTNKRIVFTRIIFFHPVNICTAHAHPVKINRCCEVYLMILHNTTCIKDNTTNSCLCTFLSSRYRTCFIPGKTDNAIHAFINQVINISLLLLGITVRIYRYKLRSRFFTRPFCTFFRS